MIAPEVFALPDERRLVRAAAEEVVRALRAAVEGRGRAALVLAGGSTPRPLYRLLAAEYGHALDWGRVDVFFGDERLVPPDDPQSNYRLAADALLSALPDGVGAVYAVPTAAGNAEAAARAYEAALRSYFNGGGASFDLALLGLGEDGHTASLFPDSPALAERERLVVAAEAPEGAAVRERVTLTVPALNAAGTVLFLVAGVGKRDAIDAVFRDPARTPPAQLVTGRERLLWYVDEAAYGAATP